ncbi:MAG: hypothetical protein IJW28_00985 [Clostridia bacterium]|nr:hypothetical protein [Clostridia bacterium]
MKKLINKASTYAFWVGLSSAVVVLFESIGNIFGFKVDGALITEFIMSICGVLVVLGFVVKDDSSKTSDVLDDDNTIVEKPDQKPDPKDNVDSNK